MDNKPNSPVQSMFEPNLEINPSMVHDDQTPDDIEIDGGTSQLASTPGKNIILMIVFGLLSVAVIYFFVFSDKNANEQAQKQEEQNAQPVENAELPPQIPENTPNQEVGIVETPELPKVDASEAPPPPSLDDTDLNFPNQFEDMEPIEPDNTTDNAANNSQNAQPDKQQNNISDMPPEGDMLGEGLSPGQSSEQEASRKATLRKADSLVLKGSSGLPSGVSSSKSKGLAITGATQATATNVGQIDRIIAQGKMIDAVLETAINTDLPGSLRAVVTRDVYAESGKNILIPKGSRLVGKYDDSVKNGQRRVVVAWDRVIRPDGIDIAIESPGTDQLGRSGVNGNVDNKYFEIFSNSLLLSALTIGTTMVADSVKGGKTSTTSSTTLGTDGSTTSSQSGSATDYAVMDSVSNLGDTATNITQHMLNSKPTITVDQGTRIKVFVNKDLIFPKSIASSINVVD